MNIFHGFPHLLWNVSRCENDREVIFDVGFLGVHVPLHLIDVPI